jgi:carbon monoxide dehydrogenase subunit G
MARVEVRDEIDASREVVWDLVSDFGGVQRISPEVESCKLEGEGVGAVRTINTQGIVIKERLESLDGKNYTFSYSIVEGPIPFTDYLAKVELSPAGAGRTKIHWSGSFEPAGVPEETLKQLVETIYRGLIGGLKKAVAG